MEKEPDLRTLINGQTAKIGWDELQRHFARGVMICVDPELDLIEVAEKVVTDDKVAVEAWMKQGKIRNAEMDDAKRWQQAQTDFWAVASAPWVLVQEINETGS